MYRGVPRRILKGKQVQDLCELVTVSKEHALIVSQIAYCHWETGKAKRYVLIYEPGDLPRAMHLKCGRL